MAGIESIKKAIVLAGKCAKLGKAALADGTINLRDLPLLWELFALVSALKGVDFVGLEAEVKDLSLEECHALIGEAIGLFKS